MDSRAITLKEKGAVPGAAFRLDVRSGAIAMSEVIAVAVSR